MSVFRMRTASKRKKIEKLSESEGQRYYDKIQYSNEIIIARENAFMVICLERIYTGPTYVFSFYQYPYENPWCITCSRYGDMQDFIQNFNNIRIWL